MRHLGIVASSIPNVTAPTVTISSVTNFNQDRATLNGTVSANNGLTTTIKFQRSTDNSNWTDVSGGTTITNTSSNNVSVYYNATGFPNVGTLYYIRLVATNAAGTTNSSSTSFTTWNYKNYTKLTAGGDNISIPTVTPTGGSAIVPSIYDIIMFGGGGGSGYGGGGGGGYRSVASQSFNNASNLLLEITVGNLGTGADGTSSQITNSSFTAITATGGLYGGGSLNSNGGNSGSGTNAAQSGGSGGTWSYVVSKSTFTTYGAGGGGGAGGAGGAASHGNLGLDGTRGGNGGAQVTISRGGSSYTGGGGGGGYGNVGPGDGGNGSSGGSAGTYGLGGTYGAGGMTAGMVFFRYFGPP